MIFGRGINCILKNKALHENIDCRCNRKQTEQRLRQISKKREKGLSYSVVRNLCCQSLFLGKSSSKIAETSETITYDSAVQNWTHKLLILACPFALYLHDDLITI